MTDKLQDARQLLLDRIAELDREREQLSKAVERLDGIGEPSRGRRRGGGRARKSASRRRRSSGRRAPRGAREEQLLKSIKADESRRVSDHAREIGVRPQQLYPILNRLVKDDKLVKSGGRYRLKA